MFYYLPIGLKNWYEASQIAVAYVLFNSAVSRF
jgi:hypothetical protein